MTPLGLRLHAEVAGQLARLAELVRGLNDDTIARRDKAMECCLNAAEGAKTVIGAAEKLSPVVDMFGRLLS